MSDIMRPIGFEWLMNWILEEYETQGSIFGVSKLFHHADSDKKLPIFSERLEAPFGPAAGPHTQLAQNIIAAYVSGSRFFELKTVQVLDGEDLPVAKPCIIAEDECYNCEWSTELRVPEAFEEYVKAWFACKLLSRELQLGCDDGFVFNMSVGYDLEGIKTPKIDTYIEGMKNAADTAVWAECKAWALSNLDRFSKVDEQFVESISPSVSSSITLSTLHGCPPQEIERIASYLLTEKQLNTYIKCNPTLLGYDFARQTLDSLGYGYIVFDDHHFKEDLQFEDAVPMIERLQAIADENKLSFGVKLTNTFPVEVAANELPSEEMYMSGRALFPLTISLARQLAAEFDGKLRISFSGGADCENIQRLFAAGIWPITMATTLLKPGGYQRIYQIAEDLNNCGDQPFSGVNIAKVSDYADDALDGEYYRKPVKPLPERKLDAKVPLTDCFTAPCRGGCPIDQDIPAYIRLTGEGKYKEALEVITERNPLPFITGTICNHRCMDKCTRSFYEDSVHIRAVKLTAATHGFDELLAGLPKREDALKFKDCYIRVAVVGGGPAGLSAAYFLARAGAHVTVCEKRSELGGVVRHVIPEFRISEKAIKNDIKLISAMGVQFELGREVKSVSELTEQGYTHVIFATGAWKPGKLELKSGETTGVLEFLEQFRSAPESLSLGSDVVIIGGGNTAMDAARAARRVAGVKNVRLVYRRDKRNMPADEEELALALEDGVEFCELLAPVGVENGKLTCEEMELGAPDASGRRSPVPTGKLVEVPASAVIAAVGEKLDTAPYTASGIELDERGRVKVNPETLETSVAGVYIVGDAQHGPTVVVDAIADAEKAAKAIIKMSFDSYASANVGVNYGGALKKKGRVCVGCERCSEPERCLECATVCECCVDVCPNRANIAVKVPGRVMRQIIHVDGMCNECGNCAAFCPYDSAPYREKFTLYWSRDDFDNSENEGFLPLEGDENRYLVRLGKVVAEYSVDKADCGLPQELCELILAVRENYSYLMA